MNFTSESMGKTGAPNGVQAPDLTEHGQALSTTGLPACQSSKPQRHAQRHPSSLNGHWRHTSQGGDDSQLDNGKGGEDH